MTNFLKKYHEKQCAKNYHEPTKEFFNLGNRETIILGSKCKYCEKTIIGLPNGHWIKDPLES